MIGERKIEELDVLNQYLKMIKRSQAGDGSAMDDYLEWRYDDSLVCYLVDLYIASQDNPSMGSKDNPWNRHK